MATMDIGTRPRDTLPSISHLDLDHIKSDKNDHSRYYLMNGLSISTAPLSSPTTAHSGPPPPYSCAPSTSGSATGLSGYISPPESTTRRSTRDEKDSPGLRKSLPSIHEALGDKSISFNPPLSASSQPPQSSSSTTVGQPFPDGPTGPVNPFSQPSGPPPVLKDVFAPSYKPSSSQPEMQAARPSFSPTSNPDPRQPVSQHFGYPGSPRSHPSTAFRSSSLANTSFNSINEPHPPRSPPTFEQPRSGYSFPQYNSGPQQSFAAAPESYQFTAGPKPEEHRAPYARPGHEAPYGDTVKRHLDVFDTEMGLNEISEASARTLDFSRIWGQRYQQSNRNGYFQDSLPGLHEIDDMLRQSHRIYENLTHLREVVIAQQNALSEQRARLARGNHMDEDYHNLSDEYKGSAFGGNDAKKRRGKAAPPGRCHSCNRAETPEWRRGPDGARTLCNACGLHYAKLTRKMGVNKAAALTGSNLRPKSLDSTRP
ncbi:hypothetical protein LTR84_004331 [Exophiala bonariae]|uniref:GATA-type domain-containing protein n=1 Tax=Exophiala bonariae TaxID=1690606 RepID=A0AAV9N8T3_9EURO|nr:hypothetical protein LTR84_004331 [Exophiala bonariae]